MHKKFFAGLIIISLAASAYAHRAKKSMPHNKTPQPQPAEQLVEITSLISTIHLDLRYATTNNFTGQTIYPVARCFLHKKVADALHKVHKSLSKKGLGLKLFDGYRPLSVQQRFYDIVQDDRYVSDPKKNAGRHTRGTAIDLTLVRIIKNKDGSRSALELDMPTSFDDFSPKAHADATEGISTTQIKNRALLRSAMEKHGFKVLPTEWWHFDYCGWETAPRTGLIILKKDGWKDFPPLDISLDAINVSQQP